MNTENYVKNEMNQLNKKHKTILETFSKNTEIMNNKTNLVLEGHKKLGEIIQGLQKPIEND